MDELKEKIARAIAYKKYSTPYDELMHYVRSQFEGQAQAALTAIEEAGFRIVPAQATTAQLSAGAKAWVADPARLSSTLYRAMVQAWPTRAECNARPPYATLADSATSFDPERQFEKDSGL